MIHERVLVLVGGYRPAADVAGLGQRAADVQFGAVIVPTARAQFDMALEFMGRFLADQVDRGAEGPRTGEQAGRPLEYFHPVVDGHVTERIARGVADVAGRRGNPVVLEVVDREAAGIVVVAVSVVGRDGDARRMAHDVVDIVEAEVVHVLAGDHGDRLGCLARSQDQAGRRGDSAWRIGAAVLGDGAQLVGGDHGGAEIDAAVRRLGDADGYRIALEVHRCAGATKQLGNRLVRLKLALDRTATLVPDLFRAIQHLDIRLAAELLECAAQRLGRDVELDFLRLDISRQRQAQGHGERVGKHPALEGTAHQKRLTQRTETVWCWHG